MTSVMKSADSHPVASLKSINHRDTLLVVESQSSEDLIRAADIHRILRTCCDSRKSEMKFVLHITTLGTVMTG